MATPPDVRRTLEPTEIRRCLRQLLHEHATIESRSVLCNGLTAGEFCLMYLRKTEQSRKRGGGGAPPILLSDDVDDGGGSTVAAAARCRRRRNDKASA